MALSHRLTGDLERALGMIPERQRMALLLAEVQGLNGAELGEALQRLECGRTSAALARA